MCELRVSKLCVSDSCVYELCASVFFFCVCVGSVYLYMCELYVSKVCVSCVCVYNLCVNGLCVCVSCYHMQA